MTTATGLFEPSRDDGRSDRQVVLDLIGEPEPDAFYSYDVLLDELVKGTERNIERRTICAAVNAANRSLLRERKRCMIVVRGLGYRVAHANEHLPVSWDKRRKAETLIDRGIEHLRYVREEELTENERRLHEGHLLIMAGFAQALHNSTRRHEHQEAVIDQLLRRVEALEKPPEDPAA